MEKDRELNADKKSNDDNAVTKNLASEGENRIKDSACALRGINKDFKACSKCGKTFCKYRNRNVIIILTFLFCLYGFILIVSLYFICFFKV
ncbi:hypothetical protein [Anaerofustis stercorihominis]|uniref:hypothetical protein n=1 Tax=Anaerofustis stercorihominis TaxID=214853 RepID=UPI002670F70C|nr:hypothetical protein [Anaerofustis stercorihominis]